MSDESISNVECNKDGTDTIFAPAEYYPMFPPFRRRCRHGIRPNVRTEVYLVTRDGAEDVMHRIRFARYVIRKFLNEKVLKIKK